MYCFYYRPSGDLTAGTDPAKVTAAAETLTKSPLGLADALDFYRVRADDIVVCLDAATGQTIWKTTLTARIWPKCSTKRT